MNLILEIKKAPSVDIFQQTANFTPKGGRIGRNKEAEFVLNDPTKHISNFHAEITYKNGQYYITDISSNGTYMQNPSKKLIKGEPTPLNQNSALLIGDYVIGIKTIQSGFSSNTTSTGSAPKYESENLADTFFDGNIYKEAHAIVNSTIPENSDVLSILGKEEQANEYDQGNILPELDNILEMYDTSEMVINESLSTHIDPPSLEIEEAPPIQPSTVPSPSQHHLLIKILELKLGIDMKSMNEKEQENFISQLADIVLTSLTQLRQTNMSLEKIRQQLGLAALSNQVLNPIITSQDTKEILANLNNYTPSISEHMQILYDEIDLHTVAFYTAFKNITLQNAQKFSPEKLYFLFEKKGFLSKSFTNKKALAWEAYCDMFKQLDQVNEEQIDLSELQKEYKNVLETLTLRYNNR